MSFRNLGKLGESEVEKWAHQRGIVPNKVQNDEKGWDTILEFPYVQSENIIPLPLDMRPPEISCRVQVKSTDKQNGKITGIKLSNWERMAKSPSPWFFIVIEFDGKDDAQRAYLVHVGKYWIGKTLERLRELEIKSKKPLHECTMQLTYSETDKIDSPNGASLEKAIRKHVGDDLQKYLMKKLEWIKNIGYGDFRSKVHFRLPPMLYDSAMETLVDFGIGITKEISLDSLNVEEVRFGMPRPLHPNIKPVNPRITCGEVPPSGEVDVVITETEGDILFQDSFIYYSPGNLFPFIPWKYWKLRFSSEILSFIISMRDKRVEMSLNLFRSDKPIRMSQLSKAANFIRHSAKSENVTFKMELTKNDDPFVFNIHSSDFPPINTQLNRILSTIENATFVLSSFDHFDDIEVIPTELTSQAIPLMMMRGYLKEEYLSHISTIIDTKEGIDLTNLAFMNCFYAVFGKKVFVLSGYIHGHGQINEEEEGYKVTIANGIGRCIRKRLMSRNAFMKFSIDNFADESSKVLDEQGIKSVVLIKGERGQSLNSE